MTVVSIPTRTLGLVLGVAGCLFTYAALGDDVERLAVGVQKDGRIVVPTNQVLSPAGKQVTFPGRPVDLALIEAGRVLVIKNMHDLVFLDTATGQIKQTLAVPREGERRRNIPGFSVVGLLLREDRIYASGAPNHIRVAQPDRKGTYQWATPLMISSPKVGGQADAAGLAALSGDELLVASTRGNNVQVLDVAAGKVRQTITVGVAPYMVCCPRPDRCYVTNWGGNPPATDDATGDTSGTPIRIDPRTRVANDGTVSILARTDGQWTLLKTLRVGLHPSGMALSPGKRFLYVANANSDTVSVVDTRSDEVVETISCRPAARLPFGSGSNALAVSPDGGTLYVANGTNNCLAVVRLQTRDKNGEPERTQEPSQLLGLIPTGWYPGAVVVSADGKQLFVANVKGHGSLQPRRRDAKGHNSHDHLGSVSIIEVPDAEQLAKYTALVNENNRLAYSLAGLEPSRPGVKPIPVPQRHGEPSVIKHVLYIIKENRTYDQVFGDMKEGNGDPNLILFGETVTPNHHALAREFTLFDNFYCSGVLSADGHSWCDAAYVTDYLEKAFGGFPRSYPDDGRDPLAFPATGFLWDNALAHGKTLRNYGEFVSEESYVPKGITWKDLYEDHKNGTRKVPITIKVNLQSLVPHTHPTYPYFPLTAPDAYRADLFLADWREFEKKGTLPNLLYMSLPCDHTEGTKPDYPTPRAMVADNDLALGRIVEAVSKSRFWPETCIFVVEDDPQNGFDHVDGHRTVALVISPYTRRGFVDHTSYNQTGMVKTIELVLGLPPMNQLDLSATALRACFQDKPDLRPYTARPNKIPLDEMNPPMERLTGKALYWARKSMELNLDKADQADEDTFNRILWHSVRGYDTPYPEQYVGKGDD
jgi:YVTN family beta-propeller protein